MLDEIGLRFATFGFNRNKINTSTNLHRVLRMIEIGEPGYAKTVVGQSYETFRQKLMPNGILHLYRNCFFYF